MLIAALSAGALLPLAALAETNPHYVVVKVAYEGKPVTHGSVAVTGWSYSRSHFEFRMMLTRYGYVKMSFPESTTGKLCIVASSSNHTAKECFEEPYPTHVDLNVK